MVVAVNRFTPDTDREIELIRKIAIEAGAEDAVPCEHWAKGGAGAVALAEAVIKACEKPSNFKFLYPLDISDQGQDRDHRHQSLRGRWGGLPGRAEEKDRACIPSWATTRVPICMAKTHLSLTHDPALKGAPKGWRLPIRDIRA